GPGWRSDLLRRARGSRAGSGPGTRHGSEKLGLGRLLRRHHGGRADAARAHARSARVGTLGAVRLPRPGSQPTVGRPLAGPLPRRGGSVRARAAVRPGTRTRALNAFDTGKPLTGSVITRG